MRIETTLSELLETYGSALLTQPLRLEGFLKDLHPEAPREVFLLCEVLFSGLLSKLYTRPKPTERDRQRLVLEMVKHSGVSISFAFWAIETWAEVLSTEALLLQHKTPKRSGTLNDVLSVHTKR